MIAASAGHEQVVSFLLAKGAQVNAVNNTGQCSLHYAASKDRYQVNINTNVIPLCRQSFVVKCSLIADTSPWMCKGLVSPHEIALPDIDRLANFSISLFACISCLFLFFLANTFRQTQWSLFSPTESVDCINNLELTLLTKLRWLCASLKVALSLHAFCTEFTTGSSFPMLVC